MLRTADAKFSKSLTDFKITKNFEENEKENDEEKSEDKKNRNVSVFRKCSEGIKQIFEYIKPKAKTVAKVFIVWFVAREGTGLINFCICQYYTRELRGMKYKPYEVRVEVFEKLIQESGKNYENNYSWIAAALCSIDNLFFLRDHHGRGTQQTAWMFFTGNHGVCRNIVRKNGYLADMLGIENFYIFHVDENGGVFHLTNFYKAGEDIYKRIEGTDVYKVDLEKEQYKPKFCKRSYYCDGEICEFNEKKLVTEDVSKLSSFTFGGDIKLFEYSDFIKKLQNKKYNYDGKCTSDLKLYDPNFMLFPVRNLLGMFI